MLKKSLASQLNSSKQSSDSSAAVVAFVKLCKAATYINNKDSSNVLFALVPSVLSDLKAILFNPSRPFSRNQDKSSSSSSSSSSLWPSLAAASDVDLMIEFFLTFVRRNPHNNELLKICLNLNSPPIFHYALVKSLYSMITQHRLVWWPTIDLALSRAAELRYIFTDTLNKLNQAHMHRSSTARSLTEQFSTRLARIKDKSFEDGACSHKELLLWIIRVIIVDPYLMLHNPNKLDHETQMSIFELFNGLVSLVHDSSMPDVAQAAMQALLVLHQKKNIEKWNTESPINTFWSISSQVLFSISQKLVQHHISNYTDVLMWLVSALLLNLLTETVEFSFEKQCKFAFEISKTIWLSEALLGTN